MSGQSSRSFFQLCERIGGQVPFWVQGAGGNISEKIGSSIFIKASGFRLDQVTEDRGIAEVNLPGFLSAFKAINPAAHSAEENYFESLRANTRSLDAQPSMETGMHAVCTRKYVVHFHALSALLMFETARDEPEKWDEFVQSSGFKMRMKMIPACMPGLKLTSAIAADPEAQVFILKNHGVVMQFDHHAETEGSAISAWEDFESSFMNYFFMPWNQVAIRPSPLQVYFPDTAVFLPRFSVLLNRVGEGYQLKPEAPELDLNGTEIFRATELLHSVKPDLEELPEEIISKVGGLPTEIYRKGVKS